MIPTYISIGIIFITLLFACINILNFIMIAIMDLKEDAMQKVRKFTFIYGIGAIVCLFILPQELLLIIRSEYIENAPEVVLNGLRGNALLMTILGVATYFAYRKSEMKKAFLSRGKGRIFIMNILVIILFVVFLIINPFTVI